MNHPENREPSSKKETGFRESSGKRNSQTGGRKNTYRQKYFDYHAPNSIHFLIEFEKKVNDALNQLTDVSGEKPKKNMVTDPVPDKDNQSQRMTVIDQSKLVLNQNINLIKKELEMSPENIPKIVIRAIHIQDTIPELRSEIKKILSSDGIKKYLFPTNIYNMESAEIRKRLQTRKQISQTQINPFFTVDPKLALYGSTVKNYVCPMEEENLLITLEAIIKGQDSELLLKWLPELIEFNSDLRKNNEKQYSEARKGKKKKENDSNLSSNADLQHAESDTDPNTSELQEQKNAGSLNTNSNKNETSESDSITREQLLSDFSNLIYSENPSTETDLGWIFKTLLTEIRSGNEKLAEKDRIIEHKDQDLKSKNEQLAKKDNQINNQLKMLEGRQEENAKFGLAQKKAEQEYRKLHQEYLELKRRLEGLEYNSEMAGYNAKKTIEEKETTLKTYAAQATKLKGNIKHLEGEIEELNGALLMKNNEIDELKRLQAENHEAVRAENGKFILDQFEEPLNYLPESLSYIEKNLDKCEELESSLETERMIRDKIISILKYFDIRPFAVPGDEATYDSSRYISSYAAMGDTVLVKSYGWENSDSVLKKAQVEKLNLKDN